MRYDTRGAGGLLRPRGGKRTNSRRDILARARGVGVSDTRARKPQAPAVSPRQDEAVAPRGGRALCRGAANARVLLRNHPGCCAGPELQEVYVHNHICCVDPPPVAPPPCIPKWGVSRWLVSGGSSYVRGRTRTRSWSHILSSSRVALGWVCVQSSFRRARHVVMIVDCSVQEWVERVSLSFRVVSCCARCGAVWCGGSQGKLSAVLRCFNGRLVAYLSLCVYIHNVKFCRRAVRDWNG